MKRILTLALMLVASPVLANEHCTENAAYCAEPLLTVINTDKDGVQSVPVAGERLVAETLPSCIDEAHEMHVAMIDMACDDDEPSPACKMTAEQRHIFAAQEMECSLPVVVSPAKTGTTGLAEIFDIAP